MLGWQTGKERILRGARMSAQKKLEGIRQMNELTDMALTVHQKIIRQKLKRAGGG